MSILTNLLFNALHTVMQIALWKGHKRFLGGINDIESVQKKVLNKILSRIDSLQGKPGKELSWQEFQSQVACSNYSDWEQRIKQQKKGQGNLIDSPIIRYQPTSGSTSQVKTIPYTQLFLDELDNAISPWLSSMYGKYPGIKNGVHYWSLSWIPESKRDGEFEDTNDDSQLLSPAKRLIAYFSQPVPSMVTGAKTMEDSMFATTVFLASNSHLSMISVWSPTFALGLLDRLSESKDQVAQVLETGQWLNTAQAESLKGVKPPQNKRVARLLRSWNAIQSPQFYQTLWPRLALVSSWDTAMSEYWAKELHSRLSFAAFEGKGLWATEGVISIPFKGEYALAYQSHYYEFKDADNGKIYTAWQLKKGQRVIPIVTSGNGFLRYQMNDLMEVESFIGSVPGLVFKGRISGVDMVGEKMSPEMAESTLKTITTSNTCTPITLLAHQTTLFGKPQYIALLEDSYCQAAYIDEKLSDQLSIELSKNFHYELACDLGQLMPAICIRSNKAKNTYISICKNNGMLEGDIKIEPLKYCSNNSALNSMLANINFSVADLTSGTSQCA